MALATRAASLALIIPRANAREAGVVQGIDIYPAERLSQVMEFLSGREPLTALTPEPPELVASPPAYDEDFREVRGQEPVKRALLIAAAGGHNVLMVGPPGRRQDHAGPAPAHASCPPGASKRPWRPPRSTASWGA